MPLSVTYDDTMGNITSRSDVAGGATWTYSTTQTRSPRQGAVLINIVLVRFRAISGSLERYIASHILEFYNVKDGPA
jgi:hypothetical protein